MNNHISVTLKDAALVNLKKKFEVLRGFAKNGIPFKCNDKGEFLFDRKTGKRTLDFCPVSFSQFAKWTTDSSKNTGHQNSEWVKRKIGNFTSHSPDTLDKYPKVKSQVSSLFEAVKKKSSEQMLREQHADKLKQLECEREHWKAMAEAEGSKLLEYLDKVIVLEKKVNELQRALVSAKDGVKAIEENKDAEISELKKQLFEINRFKPVK